MAQARPPLFYLADGAFPPPPRPFASDASPMAALAQAYPTSTMPNTLAEGTPIRNARDEAHYNAQFGRSPLQDFFLGGPAEMEPDLLRTQQGEEPQPGQTRRPGALPLTRDAETGWLQLAMPKLADLAGNVSGGLVAPVEAGGVVLGAGAVRRGAKPPLKALEEPMPVDASVGLRDNPAVRFEGVSPHEFSGPAQWQRFGKSYGVPNLGHADDAAWNKSLVEYTTKGGQKFTVPGGVDSIEPFSYYDLLHMKSQGINPNDIDPAIHQKIHDRFLKTMSQGEQTPERTFNQLAFAQISPNQPLTPNELAIARTMAKGPEDLKRIGEMIPWKHGDEETPRQIVGYKTVVDEKTGKTSEKPITLREQLSSEIANKLGLGKGSEGGLGARGTADYTRIAETAQRIRQDPDFFLFRGKDEGGQTNAENWANFVERITNQTPGLSAKTGSLGSVWQNPAKADISAVDRHMGRMFDKEMFPSPEAHAKFQSDTLAKFNKGKPESEQVASYDKLPGKLQMDAMFGYLNSHPSMKYRTAAGALNPNLPAHLSPERAGWVAEPKQATLISEPYKRVLQANADVANEAGQSVFGSQWMHWDRIRNRLEPHEIMMPGLERIPRMSMEQVHQARKELADAGYFASTKEIDPITEQKVMRPVRPMTSASRAAYFTLPPLAAIGGLSAIRGNEELPVY